jgi:HSP20 family protein
MATGLITGDIRQTLDQFRRSVDQLFENFYGYPAESGRSLTGAGAQWAFSPAAESFWGENALHLRVIVPGVSQQDLKVSVQNNQLVIEGERKPPEHAQKSGYTQLSYGRFYTAVTLPSGLDLDKMSCRLRDGILDIQIPMSEKMKPRQIPVQAGEERKSITG